MLRPLVATLESQEIVIKTEDFYNSYRNGKRTTRSLDSQLFSKVIGCFFLEISLYILRGGKFNCPLGIFLMSKFMLNPNKKYIDHGATRKAKAQGEDIVVYRTKNYYFSFDWFKSSGYRDLVYKTTWDNNRCIYQYEETLLHNVV